MSPRNALATSQFCLADPGREYVVFCPAGQATTVESLLPGEEYRFRWIEIASAQIGRAQFFRASADRRQFDPRESDFALHLVKVGPDRR